MTKSRLSKLEAAAERARLPARGHHWCCSRCGGRPGGTGRAPLVVFANERHDLAPYGPDGRCPWCGAWAPPVTVLPAFPADVRLDVEGDPLKTKLLKCQLLLEIEWGRQSGESPADGPPRPWERLAARWLVADPGQPVGGE